ncbi:MAG TPA: hypothetical protein VFD92_00165 [Candidatus Binatia bacterium]|nr:hypothetical protein [Candidatus Binatia bacterium]
MANEFDRAAGREAGREFGERAGEMAGRAAETLRDAARNASDTARQATGAAGERLRDAASDLRERVAIPDSLAGAATAARETFEEGVNRLRETDFESLRAGTVDWVRKNPVEALLLGLGVGILLGTFMRSTRKTELTDRVAAGGRWLAGR